MARRIREDRRLPANVKAVQKAVRDAAGQTRQATEFRITGARGLVLHVLPSGTATWYFHYDVEQGMRRERRKLKIGRLDDVTLSNAIAAAEEHRLLVRRGADPVADKSELRTAATLAELAEERLTKGLPLRPGSERDYRHLLVRDILPAIGHLPAVSVSRQHIIELLDTIHRRGASRRADTARALLSSIYRYGMDRGLVHENPASGMQNRHDYQPRDVVLASDEIRKLWLAMESGEAVMTPTMVAIIKLALLTGQRRTEIAGIRKDELDLTSENPCLVIGRGRAKNRNQHRVPLSPPALRLIEESLQSDEESSFLFPGALGKPFQPRSVSKAMERTRKKIGIADVTVHDLRRTVGSMMTRYGVPKEIRERVLNHGGKRSSSVTESVYSWYDHDAEKRAALELWAAALDGILGRGPSEIDGYHVRLARAKGGDKVRLA